MYCISSALTVCQSSASSSPVLDRRLPAAAAHTISKTLVMQSGLSARKSSRSRFTLQAMAASNAPHLQFHKYPFAAGQIAHLAHLAVVPAHLDATTAPA